MEGLRTGGPVDAPEALCWAALDAAGVQGSYRDAVIAAGGPARVLELRAIAAFTSPRRRTRLLNIDDVAQRLGLLLPWLGRGLELVADGETVRRFGDHPALAFYGFGKGLHEIPAFHAPRGRQPQNRTPPKTVAIVGSRQAGPSWMARTAVLAERLAKAGVTVVSGGAIGIDTAAQLGARGAGGDVVVVCGRPLTGKAEAPAMVREDPGLCWLSPYGPWQGHVRSGLFAQRNSFIAAAADVVIAVCGGTRSGTRYTIEAGLRMGRPVVGLAPRDSGCPLGAIAERLSQTGAGIVVDDGVPIERLWELSAPEGASAAWTRGAEQGVLPLSSTHASGASRPASPPAQSDEGLPLQRLLAARGSLTIDAAAACLQVSVRELLADVAMLELDGAVRREGAVLTLLAEPPSLVESPL